MMGVEDICRVAGMSRSNDYKLRQMRLRRQIDQTLVLDGVAGVRIAHPKLGSRKLPGRLRIDLKDAGVLIGRDRFFALPGSHELLIQLKASTVRTTWSLHGLRHWPNTAKTRVLTGPKQFWVSDITYLRVMNGFVFQALSMDAWGRTIVGYDCSDTLEMQGALPALSMAIKSMAAGASPVHHSDRGCQYCSHAYIDTLQKHGLGIRITWGHHCYENAQARRLIGILKQEYGLGQMLLDTTLTRKVVDQAVSLYHDDRPHGAIGNRVPMQLYRGPVTRRQERMHERKKTAWPEKDGLAGK